MVLVGDRVIFGTSPGTVRFVGPTEFSAGVWCGVELDSATGKNDGSVQGVRYFECPEAHGIFVREPTLELMDPSNTGDVIDRKKRRETNTGVIRNPSRAGTRSASRASMGDSARSASRGTVRESSRSASAMASRVSTSESTRRASGPVEPMSRVSTASTSRSPSETDETQRLKNIVTKLQDKLMVMHTDISTLKGTVEELGDQKAEILVKSAKLEEDLEVAAIDKETLEEQNELLHQKAATLTQKNEELQAELDALKEELQLSGDVGGEGLGNLVERNEILEQALLKLRDHTDDLQSQLEKALIDANKNNEIPKEVVEAHKKTMEKLSATEKRVKDLEELKKEADDLEKLHLDTENELQEEIHSLETILDEKQTVIVALEGKNVQLAGALADLRRQAEKEVTFDFKKFEEYKRAAANLKRERDGLQLDFKLLGAEVEMREKILVLMSASNSDYKRYRTTAELRKFAGVYTALADAVLTGTDDLYLSMLAVDVKLSLLSFAAFLEYLSDVHMDVGSSMELQDLESITAEYIHHIKEQEHRNLPSLGDVQETLQSQLDVADGQFPKRLQATYICQKRLLSLKTVQEVITQIGSRNLNGNVEQVAEITKLYQLVLKCTEWTNASLARLSEEASRSNEIEKCEIASVLPSVKEFINGIIGRITSLDFKSGRISLVAEFKSLINVLESLPTSPIEFVSRHVTEVRTINLSEDAEVLHSQLLSSTTELVEKNAALEEATAKIQVLQARLQHLRDTEELVQKYRGELEQLKLTNATLDSRVDELVGVNDKLNSELHKARNNNLLHNSHFETLLEQKQYTEKASLVSEIQVLQRAVRHYTSSSEETIDRSWLRREIPLFKPFHSPPTQADRLREIGRGLQKAVNRSHNHIIQS